MLQKKISYVLCLLILMGIASQEIIAQNKNIAFRSNKSYGQLSNIWGYVDSSGTEYALAGAFNYLSIVDVSDPENPAEKFTVPGPNSGWREIRTWEGYAYVTTEGGGGVTIVDLRDLPNSINPKIYTGDGVIAGQLDKIHALHIDHGKLYLYGGNLHDGKAKIFSLADPWNPTYIATVSDRYVHDGYVWKDTLYSGQIYAGLLEIIDATDPQNPVVINSQLTPNQFTHNTWLSSDHKVIYTTDEVDGSYITSYDISDIHDIKELDRIQSNPGSGSIPHNTYVLNNPIVTGVNTDFLVTSYYTDGVTIVDAARPDNLVQVGNYDTAPNLSGGGTNGTWGVYPFLPSGNLLISNIQGGMYVLTPSYKRACYLEGTVVDSATGIILVNATITAIGHPEVNTISTLSGGFKSGTADSGYYTLQVVKEGYITQIVDSVYLDHGVVKNLQIKMVQRPNFVFEGLVKDGSSQALLSNAQIRIFNDEFTYNAITDANGEVQIDPLYSGTYTMYVGKAGWKSIEIDSLVLNSQTGTYTTELKPGFYDDMIFDFGWDISGTATSGQWVRDVPIGTSFAGNQINPGTDVSDDIGDMCYVTGNKSGAPNTADLDGGTAILTSPNIDATVVNNPSVGYYRWFVCRNLSGLGNDTMYVELSNGTETKRLETITPSDTDNGTWVNRVFRIADFMIPTSTMKLIFHASDLGTDHIVEAGVDKVELMESPVIENISQTLNNLYILKVYPNPLTHQSQIYFDLRGHSLEQNAKIELINLLGERLESFTVQESKGTISLDMDLRSGIYFIRLSNGNNQQMIKVIK